MIQLKTVLKTHVGWIREVNEDCAGIFQKDDGPILAVVADGMGGHRAGDVASQLALDTLAERFEAAPLEIDEENWSHWLMESVKAANEAIYGLAKRNQSYSGMGTTIVAALFLDDSYLVAHVGDSRAYRLFDGRLHRITDDHTLVNELVRSGQLNPDEAEVHPQRNVITRALGTEEHVKVDLKRLTYVGNEQIMLCSDGLSNMLSEQEITEILLGTESLEEKATRLLQSALDAGGDDNITLILIGDRDDVDSKE